ncbi:MAG: hypothetical protein ABSD46_08010 [Bacteroidota bacterium]
MKNIPICRIIFIVVVILLFVNTVLSQAQSTSVVYLRNGTVIKGTIVEVIPENTLKIKIANGSIIVCNFAEIKEILKESDISRNNFTDTLVTWDHASDVAQTDDTAMHKRKVIQEKKRSPYSFVVYSAWSIPNGECNLTQSNSVCRVKNGIAFGFDINIDIMPSLVYTLGLNISFIHFDIGNATFQHAYGMDTISYESGSYTSIWVPTGLMLSEELSSDIELHIIGEFGILIGSIPDIKYKITSPQLFSISSGTINGTISGSIGFGFGAGINFGHIMLMIRYFSGPTDFSLETIDRFHQPTACVQMCVGIGF